MVVGTFNLETCGTFCLTSIREKSNALEIETAELRALICVDCVRRCMGYGRDADEAMDPGWLCTCSPQTLQLYVVVPSHDFLAIP